MFASIAPRYELMNRLMTLGQDRTWRREVVRRAAPAAGQRLLDLGTGTGDIAREALRREPGRSLWAPTLPQMMKLGLSRPGGGGCAG
jgi:demethylmenaquinone methyltransferase/2-methoxy-6-polyprenyl-1,4-benzoquinol methylase